MQCVLVRAHSPTRAQMHKLKEWAKEVPLYLSLDVSSWSTNEQQTFQQTYQSSFLGLHFYTENDLLRSFPQLHSIRTKFLQTDETVRGTRTLAWGMHVECIVLWYENTPAPFQHVWVVEADVGIVGGAHHLLHRYHDDTSSDLITYTESLRKVQRNWMWYRLALPNFQENVRYRVHGYEHVQRFSSRFLLYLQKQARAGWNAWSEMAVPSLCIFGQFTIARLQQCHPDFYNPFVRLSEPEWLSLTQNNACGTLVHSLKF